MGKKKYLVIDVSRCHDCNNCFVSCKDEFFMNSWLPYSDEQPRHGPRWMNIERLERGQYPRVDVCYLPKPCQHCSPAPCAKAFPDIVTTREDGIVMLDTEKAKGQRGLVDVCPYGAIWYNEEKDVAQKCILCAHILDGNAGASICMPRCAHCCPTEALTYVEADEEAFAKRIAEEGLERYKSDFSDNGQVWYKNLYRFTKHFITGGLIKDGECADGVKVTLKGADAPEQLSGDYGDFRFDGLDPGTYAVLVDGKEIWSGTIAESLNIGNINI
ncbi:MAG: (4Fe-4S)-binding protein [Clostridiales Family XIII bacterium]|nr:(4Fe-4S)-binding protein [Clostridiales Family XIII bacterium]